MEKNVKIRKYPAEEGSVERKLRDETIWKLAEYYQKYEKEKNEPGAFAFMNEIEVIYQRLANSLFPDGEVTPQVEKYLVDSRNYYYKCFDASNNPDAKLEAKCAIRATECIAEALDVKLPEPDRTTDDGMGGK